MKNLDLSQVAVVSVDNTKTFEDADYQELYVSEGEQAAIASKAIMDLLRPYGALMVNVLEEHPQGHISFVTSYKDKQVFQSISYDEVKDWTAEENGLSSTARFTIKELQLFLETVGSQTLWPEHSKAWTDSSELMEPLQKKDFDLHIVKGNNVAKEAYSGFDNTNLDEQLKMRNIKKLIVSGVATDYCVGNTALDAAQNDYEVIVVQDAVRGVAPDSTNKMLQEFTKHNIKYLTLDELKQLFFAH
ncbi:MAG: isochorismatase family protein [Candidatus Absconditabacteria bacterium]